MTVVRPRHGGPGLAVDCRQEAQAQPGWALRLARSRCGHGADRPDLSGPEPQAPDGQVVGLYQPSEFASVLLGDVLTARSWVGRLLPSAQCPVTSASLAG